MVEGCPVKELKELLLLPCLVMCEKKICEKSPRLTQEKKFNFLLEKKGGCLLKKNLGKTDPKMRKLPSLANNSLQIPNLFEESTQLTVKIHENYHVAKENCFKSISSQREDTLHILISFVKITQCCLGRMSNIIIRYWRNTEDTRREAYTIAVSGIPRNVINKAYEKLCQAHPNQLQGVNVIFARSYYQSLCERNGKKAPLPREIFDDEDFGEMDDDDTDITMQDGDNANSLYDESAEVRRIMTSRRQDKKGFWGTFSYENTKKYLMDKKPVMTYEPVVDFEVKPSCYFYSVIRHTPFPWYLHNTLERIAFDIYEELANDQLKFIKEPLDLETRCDRHMFERRNWLSPDGDDDDDDDDDDYGDPSDEDEDVDEEGTRRKKKKKKKRTCDDDVSGLPGPKSYFNKFEKRDRLAPGSNRVFSMSIPDMGPHQELKEPMVLLKRAVDRLKRDPLTTLDKLNELFGDFWTSSAIYNQLSVPMKSVYTKFMKKRSKFRLLVLNKNFSLIGNVIMNLSNTFKCIFGLRNTAGLLFMHFISRDTAFNPYETLGVNLFAYGRHGIGKTLVTKYMVAGSTIGSVMMNSITESAKAGLGAYNRDNYGTVLETDAGPLFTREFDKLSVEHQTQLKGIIARISEASKHYNVFVNKEGKGLDPFQKRDTIRISNQCHGPSQVVSNDPPRTAEYKDRYFVMNVKGDNSIIKMFNVTVLKIAEEMMSQFDIHQEVKDVFLGFMKEIQGDLAMYFLHVSADISPTPILIVAMLVADFCLNRLEESLPFFRKSSRKFVILMYIAITLSAYRVKVQLCNLEGGLYDEHKHIVDIGKFCTDFAKRMIVGYEEIIPALFIMLPQYIDSDLIEIVNIIKKHILGITETLDSPDSIARWFQRVVLNEENKLHGYPIDLKKIGDKSRNFNFSRRDQRPAAAGGGGGDGGNTFDGSGIQHFVRGGNNAQSFGSGGNNNPDPMDEHVDPNNITFSTDMSKRVLAEKIKERMSSTISVDSIIAHLNSLKTLGLTQEKKFKLVKSHSTSDNIDIYSSESANRTPIVIVEGPVSDKKPMAMKNVYVKENGRGKNIYTFPLELFRQFDVSPYKVLKKIVTEELPFQSQGLDPIVVSAVKFPEMDIENLVVEPSPDSRVDFEINNPKKLMPDEMQFYKAVLHQYMDRFKRSSLDQVESSSLFNSLISKGKLVFKSSLYDLAKVRHKHAFGTTDTQFTDTLKESSRNLEKEFQKIQNQSLIRALEEYKKELKKKKIAQFEREQQQQQQQQQQPLPISAATGEDVRMGEVNLNWD